MHNGGGTAADVTTLQMALVGYEVERQRIDQKIREIQSQLGGKRRAGLSPTAAPAIGPSSRRGRRTLSAAARERIAAAQRKRWAEHRKRKAAGSRA